MDFLRLVTWAPIGLLLVNSVPHLMAGRAGRIFKTPFGRYSSPVANLRWGAANALVGIGLLGLHLAIRPAATPQLIAVVIGALIALLNFVLRAKTFYDDRLHADAV